MSPWWKKKPFSEEKRQWRDFSALLVWWCPISFCIACTASLNISTHFLQISLMHVLCLASVLLVIAHLCHSSQNLWLKSWTVKQSSWWLKRALYSCSSLKSHCYWNCKNYPKTALRWYWISYLRLNLIWIPVTKQLQLVLIGECEPMGFSLWISGGADSIPLKCLDDI